MGPFNLLNSNTALCLFSAWTWISHVMFRGPFVLHDLRSEVVVRFVDISVIVEHHCLNFLFMKFTRNLVNRQKWFYRFSLFSVKMWVLL
jgi:hypothetical protein